MKKTLVLFIILLLTALLSAEEAGITATPYGMAQYRLRLKVCNQTPTSGEAQKAMDYFNMIGYDAGAKIKLNTQTSMQFQVGNDCISTEEVDFNANNYTKKGLYPYFHLAYAKFDPGRMNVAFGIQPVVSNGPLDLLDRSLRNRNYACASQLQWAVGTNNSMMGLKLGAPLVKGEFNLNAELFTTIIEKRTQLLAVEPKSNPSAVMFVLDLPMTIIKDLAVTPQAAAILNRNYNSITESGDHEIAGGFSANYKLNPIASFCASAGAARLSNENSRPVIAKMETLLFIDTTAWTKKMHIDTTFQPACKQAGLIFGVGTVVNAGPGKINFDIKYSSDENQEVAESKSGYFFADLKYSCVINKYLVLMPRIRVFRSQYGANDLIVNTVSEAAKRNGVKLDSKTEIRPELIFIGQF